MSPRLLFPLVIAEENAGPLRMIIRGSWDDVGS